MRAVQFDSYGGVDALDVREVPDPEPGPGQVRVRVRAAAINPGEAAIRQGAMHDRWPATFPSGQGSDFAGVIDRVGDGVGDGVGDWNAGDEVLGWSDNRNSQAQYVVVGADQLAAKPAELSWPVAGSLYVGPLAGVAGVRAAGVRAGDTVLVAGAAGGVGGAAAQYAKHLGARVIGLAGPANHDWLRSRGIEPVEYGPGQADRIRAAAPHGIDAVVDAFGGGYLDLGIELGVDPSRMTTLIDFAGAQRLGANTAYSHAIVSPDELTALAQLVADGQIEIPIAATYPLDEVRAAYERLEDRHTRGKIALLP